jgi:hypothetical protein
MTSDVTRRIILFLMLLPCWSSAAQQYDPAHISQKPALVLEGKPTKLVYAKGETVEFDFTLRNVSGDRLIVARWLQLTLNVGLDISDSQGNTAEWCGRIADEIVPSKSRYKTLAPGESVSAKLAVSCVNKNDRRHAWGFVMDAPGKYMIKATYRLPQPKEYFHRLFPTARVIQGPVSAEPVTIELK